MTMENKRNVPAIRFKGFDKLWNKIEMSEVATFNPKAELPEAFEYVDLESVVGTKMISHRTEYKLSAPSRAQRLAKRGDLFYQTVRPYQKNNYLFDKDKDNYVFSTGYAQLRPHGNGCFLLALVQGEVFVKTVLDKCTGTSYPAISSTDLSKIKVLIPDKNEQKSIGNYFQNIDRLINTSQAKLDKLKTIKKACLEKMFPCNGSNIPEIRFKGFMEEWKEMAIENIASDFYGGGTPRTSIERYWNGDIPWIQTSDLKEDVVFGVVPQKHISESGIKESATKLIPENSIAIITRVGVGKLSFIQFKYTTSQDFLSISKLKIDEYFAAYTIHRKMQTVLKEVQGTSIKGVTKEELLTKQIKVPTNRNEQKAIGRFFKNLDDLIAKMEQQINKLKNIKKACLDKMFVN